MLENIKIFATDKVWQHILADLGGNITDSPKTADVVFDDIGVDTPISIMDLQRIVFDSLNNVDIIKNIFGKYIVLPTLQHKIIVSLYKNPGISIRELKNMVGVLPDMATHTVENAIYQLRQKYGYDFISNENGRYKIGHV